MKDPKRVNRIMNKMVKYVLSMGEITESEWFREAYRKDNYKVVFDGKYPIEKAVIYFSDAGIFYPNTEDEFRKTISIKNKYSFYKSRLSGYGMHIFLRDLHKASYNFGINNKVNSIEQVALLLQELTKECKEIVTVGISAGGFAAVVLGIMLKAKKCIVINPLYSLSGIYEGLNFEEYPKVFTLIESKQDFNLRSLSFFDSKIVHIFSFESKIDKKHYEAYKDLPFKFIQIKSNEHGAVFDRETFKILGKNFDKVYNSKKQIFTRKEFLKFIHGRPYFVYLIKAKLCTIIGLFHRYLYKKP